jgi:hypothetical protein
MNALLRKEIRDAVRWLPLGILLLGLLLVYFSQWIYAPQLSSVVFTATWFSAMLYGSFLSLVTFLPDEREAARAFLIHRAITPNQIFRTRVTVGLLVYSLGLLIPLALLAAYLAAIGPERLPVSPWQVTPAIALVAAGSIFYFAGILIACRQANWFGTRLLPLASAVAGSFLSISVLAGAPLYVTLPVYLLSCASAVLMAFAARHAFVRIPSQVHPTRVRSESLPMRFVLLSASILLVGALGLLPLNFIMQANYRYATTEFDKNGMPVFVIRGLPINRVGSREILESIPMIDPSQTRPEQTEATAFGTQFLLVALDDSLNKFDPTFVQMIGDRKVFFDLSGYLLVYQSHQVFGEVLECVISSDAVSLPHLPRGTPFQKAPRLLIDPPVHPQVNFGVQVTESRRIPFYSISEWLFATNEGIIKANVEKRTVELVLKESIDSVGWSITGDSQRIVIHSGDSLRVFKSNASEPGVPPSQFTLEATLDTVGNAYGLLSYGDSANWTYLDGFSTQRNFKVTRCTNGKTSDYDFAVPDITMKSLSVGRSESPFIFGAMPPLLSVGSSVILQRLSSAKRFDATAIDYLPLLMQILVAIVLTIVATKHRGLNSRQTTIWVVLAAVLGLGVPLGVMAIYPAAVYEICSGCHRRRRVENTTCEHCGADWEVSSREGIEIVESEPAFTAI